MCGRSRGQYEYPVRRTCIIFFLRAWIAPWTLHEWCGVRLRCLWQVLTCMRVCTLDRNRGSQEVLLQAEDTRNWRWKSQWRERSAGLVPSQSTCSQWNAFPSSKLTPCTSQPFSSTTREHKGALYDGRSIPGWIWKLNWQIQNNRRKVYKFH